MEPVELSSGSAASKASFIHVAEERWGRLRQKQRRRGAVICKQVIIEGESASANHASSLSSSCTAILRSLASCAVFFRRPLEVRVAPPGAVPHSRRRELKSEVAPAADTAPEAGSESVAKDDETRLGLVGICFDLWQVC